MSRRTVLALLALVVVGIGGYLLIVRDTDGRSEGQPTAAVGDMPASNPSTAPPAVDPSAPDSAAAIPEAEISAAAAVVEQRAIQAVTTAFSWQPGVDSSPSDAYARARPWFTSTLAERTIVADRPDRGPGVQWAEWSEQRAIVQAHATVGCSGCPPDTDRSIHRVATVHQELVDTSGKRSSAGPDTNVWLTFINDDGQWLIDDFRY